MDVPNPVLLQILTKRFLEAVDNNDRVCKCISSVLPNYPDFTKRTINDGVFVLFLKNLNAKDRDY